MSDATNKPNNETNSNGSASTETPATTKLIQHFKTNYIDCLLYALRLVVIIFTLLYLIPIFGCQCNAFQKVLLANAAISALRLHQRLPTFTFSREFLARVFVEDSCHYLVFSVIFLNIFPSLLVLVPVFLFALLHASSYSLRLLDLIGQNSWWGARLCISLVEFQAQNMLKAAALAEIFIMPFVVVFAFMGHAGLITPIIYYNFLVMRYTSHRNAHTRLAFMQLRILAERFASSAPSIVGRAIYTTIGLVNRLAPQMMPVPPHAQ